MNHHNTKNASNYSAVDQITHSIYTLTCSHAQIVKKQLVTMIMILQAIRLKMCDTLNEIVHELPGKFNKREQVRGCTFLNFS